MSARDAFHQVVRRALEKERWTITHDPLKLVYGVTKTYVDLGADSPVGAERDGERIAVEVKSFLGRSEIAELEKAVGQFMLYRTLLRNQDPGRRMYIAVPRQAFEDLFSVREGIQLVEACQLEIIVYDYEEEVIVRWIEQPITGTL